ncbi:MAG: hypothetical protein BMS9Abin29_0534 [Gemmatimonadota bacterium]|nr:MAG: hypothetical protein BMS9Abin29_0534 [Gemmatimonadota bacterium]
MTRFYIEREPGTRDNVGALAVTLGVAAVTFYLVRAFLAREPVESGGAALHEPPRAMASREAPDESA